MMQILENIPHQLNDLNKKVEKLFFIGDTNLLQKPMVAIVGSRRPGSYTKLYTSLLAKALSKRGVCIVSGAAMGVDAIAHLGAMPNTIAVMGNSLDIIYPKVNKTLIHNIYDDALAISEYDEKTIARKYSFVERNRIVVGLSKAVVITQADKNSGSMRSAKIAMELGRPIYVLPQKLGESEGTLELIADGKAKLITDIDKFADMFGSLHVEAENDDLLAYCEKENSVEKVIEKFGDKVYEYELDGKVIIDGTSIYRV